MPAIKVLMADDEPAILEIMARKVAANGFEVVVAHDGQEAWERIVSENPDVIILDVNMPRLDGWSVLNRLRHEPPSKKWQPVIMVSTETENIDIQKGMDLGANHYLTKPCTLQDIIKGINLMVNLIPLRQEPPSNPTSFS